MTRRRGKLGAFVLFSLFLRATPAWAKHQIAVVAAPGSHIGKLSESQARDYFLGVDEFLADGSRVAPVDQAKDAPITADFYNAVAGMTAKDLAVYRAKRVFTGRGAPPPQVEGGDVKVKEWVKTKENAMGYIDAGSVDASVKVLLTIDP